MAEKRSHEEMENIDDVDGSMSSTGQHPRCSSDIATCEEWTEGHVF